MKYTQESIQKIVIETIQDVVRSWGEDLTDAVQTETYLVQNLNFASVDFIQLIVAIEDQFAQKLGFHDLLMPEGTYIDDLNIGQLTSFIYQKVAANDFESQALNHNQTVINQVVSESQQALPQSSANFLQTVTIIDKSGTITEDKIAAFQNTIPVTQRQSQAEGDKNPRAIFVLSTPRSGSTLFRIVLAGNPALFAPPELHLLDYNTLADRKAALDNELNSHLLEGTIRAIMHLQTCDAETAQMMMQSYEAQNWSTKAFYQQLQQWSAEQILVDKTPTYASRREYLDCAEAEFDQPFYIHLVRHPYGMIRSFEDAELDKLIPFMRNSSFTRRELAELIWITTNQTIAHFLQTVPISRQIRIRYENLVAIPELTIRKLCHALKIDFNDGMLNPYADKKQRMTDGVHTTARFSGDLKFHLHQGINSEVADRWRKFHTVNFLGTPTCQLAKSFGYEV